MLHFTFATVIACLRALLTPAGLAGGAWLHARYGRKLRLKIGEIEVEAQTLKQVERLLSIAEASRQNSLPRIIHDP
jgi:hypothetical protein